MNSEIDPEDAIKKIIAFSNQIDAIFYMDYTQGEKTKTLLEIRIKNFIRATFRDDDKKIQDLESDRNSHKKRLSSSDDKEVLKQKNYETDLEILRNHLIGYKDELELISNSRKKKVEPSSKDVIKENAPSLAQIRVYGILGIIIAVVTGTSTVSTYPNFTSVAIFGIFTLIFGILGIGCLVKPDSFGETLFLLLKQLGGKVESQKNDNNQQRQKNPKNSPQVINQGSGTVNVLVGTQPKLNEDEEDK